MRWTFAILVLIALAIMAWALGNALSSDAIGLALGVVFGVMASLPGAILVLVAARRRQPERDPFYPPPRVVYEPPTPPSRQLPPPVVVVFEDPEGRRARVEFADGVEARRFLGEGRTRLVDNGRRQ